MTIPVYPTKSLHEKMPFKIENMHRNSIYIPFKRNTCK
uniref:Uncharacterized protein n=1 Tax=Anguilla anguilla TaxID=7936 RepID=A0A0E9RJE8_ANGAN